MVEMEVAEKGEAMVGAAMVEEMAALERVQSLQWERHPTRRAPPGAGSTTSPLQAQRVR